MKEGSQDKLRFKHQPLCFAPVCSGSDLVLILGSFPGKMSLEKDQYYAHPRNGFWPIMGRLFSFDHHIPYPERIDKLQENRIAIWDVLHSCSREGSLDSSIARNSMVINDFETLFKENPLIHSVLFNGSRAETEFRTNVLKSIRVKAQNLSLYRLPSTSPAMAMLSIDQKIKAWSIVKDLLK